MAEFGSCFRNEPSGALHGLLRVRGFTQDDAHIFCTLEQVEKEIFAFIKLAQEVYKELLGDVNIIVKFSDRPTNRAGSDEVWDKSESMLYNAAKASGLELITNKAPNVRVIDENGESRGILSLKEALELASDANLDLVEVSPNSDPPVCKIINYGKFKYQQQKLHKSKKKHRVIIVKELQLSLHIAEHDYNVKLAAAKRFLEHKYKVKVTLRLRGRQMVLKQEAIALMQGFFDKIGPEIAKLEVPPKMEGNTVNMIISN
ncbi:UNVERIFIED_CONTAM: hypothetical protein PYX00_011042 [Menopon gallinae]|uniref:Aminoacyl-transfer RNA synthetases class-II family profile domain-containing protein n=1 Tax=Menopon gallinae TaxID=328185 RepID=A0AAW2H6F3_9NEOP